LRLLGVVLERLGVIVDEMGMRPDPDKLRVVEDLKVPVDVPALRRFLGSVGYFRRFISEFAQRAVPLTKDAQWEWTEKQETAFKDLKSCLMRSPIVLSLPHPTWKWILDTDASGIAVAAVLQQQDAQGKCHVVAYASKTLTEGQKKWSIRELEALAIVWATLFAEYIRHQTFLVRTDHESLRWLWRTDNKRVARWALARESISRDDQQCAWGAAKRDNIPVGRSL